MKLENIKELVLLFSESDISELRVEEGEEKLVIKREKEVITTSLQPQQIIAPQAAIQPQAATQTIETPEAASSAVNNNLHYINSPLVGTFYRSASPDAEPFIEVGTKVKKGQTICIIEAMKLMNEIESDIDGTVVELAVENAHPVEYGAPIIGIEPA